jgi:DHA1 family bicyclomycin/chloramphenicol resistance-like MFS transporter
MLASRLNIRALRKYGPAEAVARHVWLPLGFGLALLLAAGLMAPPLVLLLALQLSYFVGVGRVTPHAAALAMAPHGQDAGAASGMMGALHSLVAMIVSIVVATVNDGTVSTLAAIMTVTAVCSALSYVWIRRCERSAGST